MNSLHQFGTVAFDASIMSDLIFLGEAIVDEEGKVTRKPGSDICLAIWLAVVPEVYREEIEAIGVRECRQFLGQKANEPNLHRIIGAIRNAIWQEVEPR